MKKNMRNQNSGISLENSHPGCMWSILHVLHYNRWHHVKKMLPYRRHGTGGRHIAVVGDPESSTTTASFAEATKPSGEVSKQTAEVEKQSGEIPKQTDEMSKQTGEVPKQTDSKTENSVVEEKTKGRNPVAKVSRRYRIMSMFTDEMYKRRGRHRRSASCPIQGPEKQTNSTQQSDSIDKDTPAVVSVNDRPKITNQDDDKTSSVDPHTHTPKADDDESVTKNKNCKLCAAMLTASYSTKPNIEDNAEEHRAKDSSPEESKQFLNALDIFNTRKEMFLKVMQEPKSPMETHFPSPRTLNSEKRLTKSESFLVKNVEDSSSLNQMKVEYSNNFPLGSPRPLTNQHDSGAVLRRFKNLKQKLSHVIQESRKEKQRILMDGFLHKIPYGHRLSKDPKESDPSGHKSTQKQFKRAASLNESVDKYCRLFESSFNRETKQQHSENYKLRVEGTPTASKSAPKKLARIQSLPDMRSYEYYPSNAVTPDRSSVDRNISIGRSKFDEQKTQDPENQTRFDSSAENGGDAETLGKRTKSLDDMANAGGSAFDYEHGTEHTLMPSSKPEKPSIDSASEYGIHEDKTGPVDVSESQDGADSQAFVEPATEIQNIEIPAEQIRIDFQQARAERKDSVEFNYVKDVLQVAGFGGTDFLGTWHTTGQPVDPSVFEEVGGCLLAEPDSSVNEEGDKSNHLLLFDLINEVLLEIHERSFTYCPVALTCRSDIHPMPVGYHVLEEVWANVDRYLSWRPEFERTLDDAVSKDLARGDGWMNLQFEAECVGLELEGLIFDELLDEFIWE